MKIIPQTLLLHTLTMGLEVYKWVISWMPNLESCMLFHMDVFEVEHLKCQRYFNTREDCIEDGMKNFPDTPLKYSGPYLYILEYHTQSGLLVKCTRSVGM